MALLAAVLFVFAGLVGAAHHHLDTGRDPQRCAVCATLGTTGHAVTTAPVLAPVHVVTLVATLETVPTALVTTTSVPRPPRGPPAAPGQPL